MPFADLIHDLAPVLLALSSAVLFALSIQVMNLGLRYTDPETGSLIHIASTTAIYWLVSPLFVQSWYWLTTATIMFAVVGLFRPVLSANLALNAVRHLGPTLTSTLAATSPLFGVAFGVSLFAETLTWPIIAGTAAIMCGLVVMARRGRARADWPTWALMLPLGAALCRAAGHALTKYAYAEVASAFFAAMISYTVSFVVAFTAHRLRHRRVVGLRTRGVGWFVLAGFINGVSVLSLNSALRLGQIVTVVPIVSAAPVITLLLTVFVFRSEAVTWRAVLTMGLVMPGVVLIALSH